MTPKLSFIVPVYNVEKYLRKCVESLIHQDFRDYEMILVDDGSTDKSPQICDEFASIDNRWIDDRYTIRVIHQKNGGLSAARNAGLEVAQGEYVCFVDSDDYWEENVLGHLMEQIERDNLDVLRFNYQNVNERYVVFLPYKHDRRLENDYSDIPTDGASFLNARTNTQCYAVMYIMRREIVPTFMDGIHFEDVEWLPRMILSAKRIASTDAIVYNYFVRKGSITQVQGDKEKTRKNIEDRMYIIGRYKQYMEENPSCKWLKDMQSSMASGVLTTIAIEFYEKMTYYIEQLRTMNVFPLSLSNMEKTYKRRAMLTNIVGPYLYCRIMHHLHGEQRAKD